MISKVEIDFPVPVNLPDGWDKKLYDLVHEVCDKYKSENPGNTMWAAGVGSKPTYIPMTMEEERQRGMEFDESIFYIEVAIKVKPAVFPKRTTDG